MMMMVMIDDDDDVFASTTVPATVAIGVMMHLDLDLMQAILRALGLFSSR